MSSDDHPPTDDPFSLDAAFHLLSHHLRRSILTELHDNNRPQAVADLAKEIAANQQDTSIDDVPDEALDRIHTSLYHSHIPKLEDSGAIAVDPEQKTVTLTARGERLCSRIDQIVEQTVEPQTTD